MTEHRGIPLVVDYTIGKINYSSWTIEQAANKFTELAILKVRDKKDFSALNLVEMKRIIDAHPNILEQLNEQAALRDFITLAPNKQAAAQAKKRLFLT